MCSCDPHLIQLTIVTLLATWSCNPLGFDNCSINTWSLCYNVENTLYYMYWFANLQCFEFLLKKCSVLGEQQLISDMWWNHFPTVLTHNWVPLQVVTSTLPVVGSQMTIDPQSIQKHENIWDWRLLLCRQCSSFKTYCQVSSWRISISRDVAVFKWSCHILRRVHL